MKPAFCASCTDERADLVPEWLNGRRVYLCRDCRLGEVRGGSYRFDGGAERPDRRLPGTVHIPRATGMRRGRV